MPVCQYRQVPKFGPMAQCVVHALKGLACRVTPASSPASHCKQRSALTSPALHARGCTSPSRARRGHKDIIFFSMGTKLRHPAVPQACGSARPVTGVVHIAESAACARAHYSNNNSKTEWCACAKRTGAVARASHNAKIALAGSHRLRSTRTAAPALFTQAVVTETRSCRITSPSWC
jgi:hypothetical protein